MRAVAAALALLLAACTTPAKEDRLSLTLYGGAARGDVDFDADNAVASISEPYDDDTPVYGGRVIGWFPTGPILDVGVGIDASYYQQKRTGVNFYEIEAVTVSTLGILRVSPPGWPVWPYAGAGFAILYQDADLGGSGIFSYRERGIGGGIDARAGLEVPLTDWLSIQAEYRFLYGVTRFQSDSFVGDLIGDVVTTETSHFGLVGISFRF